MKIYQICGMAAFLTMPLWAHSAATARTALKESIKREVLSELQADAPPAAPAPKEGVWLGSKVRISGQVRVRPEVRNDLTRTQLPTTKKTDPAVALRTRLGVQLAPTEHVGLFIQAQDSRFFGETANTTTDAKNLDLHQGYVDLTNIGGRPWMLRAGRQEVTLGDGRLVGAPDWSNVGRALDAIILSYQPDNWGMTALGAITDRTTNSAQWVTGVYGTWKRFPGGVLDGYYVLLKDNDGATGAAAGTGASLTVHTLGLRTQSTFANGLDVGVDGAVQAGKFGSNTIMAYAGHAASGYTFTTDWKPRIGLEYNYASGDDNTTARYTKFSNLLPANHNKYGMMDLNGWTNMHDAALQLSAKPGKWTAALAYHLLAVDKPSSTGDSFAGFVGAAGLGRIAGHEIDLQGKWTMNANCEIGAGYGRFLPGAYLKNQGQTRHSDFGYVALQAQF